MSRIVCFCAAETAESCRILTNSSRSNTLVLNSFPTLHRSTIGAVTSPRLGLPRETSHSDSRATMQPRRELIVSIGGTQVTKREVLFLLSAVARLMLPSALGQSPLQAPCGPPIYSSPILIRPLRLEQPELALQILTLVPQFSESPMLHRISSGVSDRS